MKAPLKIENDDQDAGQGIILLMHKVTDADGKTICRVPNATEAIENFERLINRFNLHDELLEALKWIAEHGDMGSNNRPAFHDMRAKARELIAKST